METHGARCDWDDLRAASRGPIECFEWWQACLEGLPGVGRASPLFVRLGDRCAAIAPLVVRPGRVPRLETIGVRQLYEPMDFVYSSRDALVVLCDTLARQKLPIDLPRVPGNSPLAQELERAFKGRGWVRVTHDSPYPFLAIDRGWTPASHFNAGRRSDFRRAMRRAGRAGTVEFEIVTPQADYLDRLLADAYDTELHSWKGRHGTALAIDPIRATFYRRYFSACCAQGLLRLAFMRLDGVPVAMQIAVQSHQRLWLLKIGYNEAYARMSPGTLLMLHVVQQAANSGIRSIEFLGSVEPWTRIWTNSERPSVRIRIYPLGFLGAAAFAADALQWARARLLGRWRHVGEVFRPRAPGERAPVLEPRLRRRTRPV